MKNSPLVVEGCGILPGLDTKRLKHVIKVNAIGEYQDLPALQETIVKTHWQDRSALAEVTVMPMKRGFAKHMETLQKQATFKRRYEGRPVELKVVTASKLRPLDWWIPTVAGPEQDSMKALVQYLVPASPPTPVLNLKNDSTSFSVVSSMELEVGEPYIEGSEHSFKISFEVYPGPWWTEITEVNGSFYITLGQERILAALRKGIQQIPVLVVHDADIPQSPEPWRLPSEMVQDASGPLLEDFLADNATVPIAMRRFVQLIRVYSDDTEVPTVLAGQ